MKVYPVDLMQLYLTSATSNGIAGIDLAGITPLVEKTVALGDGADYDDKLKIDRPAADQGRGVPDDDPRRQSLCLGNRAGLAAGNGGAGRRRAGRVRVTFATHTTKEFVPKVQVKVIGSDTPRFSRAKPTCGCVRRRRSSWPGHGRRPQGNLPVRVLPRHHLCRPQPLELRAGGQNAKGQGLPQSPAANTAPEQSLDANIKMQNSTNNRKQISGFSGAAQLPPTKQARRRRFR